MNTVTVLVTRRPHLFGVPEKGPECREVTNVHTAHIQAGPETTGGSGSDACDVQGDVHGDVCVATLALSSQKKGRACSTRSHEVDCHRRCSRTRRLLLRIPAGYADKIGGFEEAAAWLASRPVSPSQDTSAFSSAPGDAC